MKIFFILLVCIVFNGCATKTEIEYIKCDIPNNLLNTPAIDTNIDLNNDKEVAMFMLDLYEGYKKCKINLQAIKEINDDKWQ